MELIIGADEVENPKPHPEPIELALHRLGAAPEQTIYVGDSIHDMQSGRGAGVMTGAVLWGPFDRAHLEATAPDHWLEQPADLLAVLGIGAEPTPNG